MALGLILGVVTGAALVELLRARPPAPREVRLTVSHDAIPRRATTLADDAFTSFGPEPARGGPADRRLIGADSPTGATDRRTNVRYGSPASPSASTSADPAMAGAVAVAMAAATPNAPEAGPPHPGRIMEPAFPLGPGQPGRITGPDGEVVGITITSGEDPYLSALRNGAVVASMVPTRTVEVASGGAAAAPATVAPDEPAQPATIPLAAARSTDTPPDTTPAPIAPGTVPQPVAEGSALIPQTEISVEAPAALAAEAPGTVAAGTLGFATGNAVALLERPRSKRPKSDEAETERCLEERRLADERCELATRARAQADGASDALRAAQRSYDGHEAAAVTASWRADPRAVHDAKDAAQGGFRAAVAAATSSELLEAAARDWLNEINRINNEARDATATVAREHGAGARIGATLERLGLEADAARIAAENADAACLSARVAVAHCEEGAASDPATFLPSPDGDGPAPRLEEDETLGLALEAGGTPQIFRLLQGDRQAMTSLVASLAGDDADARRRWQLQMTDLVEAIVADAIEASALEFPDDDPFWGTFTRSQDRDISQALSSLGYRFDGLGGWRDGRHPSQRDLSLAVGYAGLDPMRVRRWPNEEATAELFRDVTVAADEYLASVAGDLTLAEMVTMLARRADGLAEVWNNWGKIRPLLLDET